MPEGTEPPGGLAARRGWVVVRGDALAWPRDVRGQPLPRWPVRGLRVEVQWGEHAALFTRWSLARVTRARFVARHPGKEVDLPLEAWGPWLRSLAGEGVLSVHWPGCAISRCSCAARPAEGPALRVVGLVIPSPG